MIYLHIGLHKVGSSTIQRFATEKAAVLAAHGVDYPVVARDGADAHHSLVAAVRAPGSTTALADAARLVASRPDDTFFFSSEGLSTLPVPHVRQIVDALGVRHRLRVLIYVRNAVDTAVAAYNQTAKHGSRLAPFDHFVAQRLEGRETTDHVHHWGEAAGFDALRVRSIERSALVGGDLLTDLCAAVGLTDAAIAALSPAQFPATNVRVPWEAAEYVREFTRRSAAVVRALDPATRTALRSGNVPGCGILRSIGPNRRAVETIRLAGMTGAAVAAATAAGSDGRAQYLTPEQAVMLDARYREALAEIARLVPDAKLDHVAPAPLPPRPFEPSFATISPAVLAAIWQAMEARVARAALPDAVRAIFAEMHGVPAVERDPPHRVPGITDPAERERRRARRAAREARGA